MCELNNNFHATTLRRKENIGLNRCVFAPLREPVFLRMCGYAKSEQEGIMKELNNTGRL